MGSFKQRLMRLDRSAAEQIVTEIGWLAERPADFRARLLRFSVMVEFAKGDTIFSAGDPPGGLYGLVDGALRVELPISGLGSRIGYVATPGFWVGAGSALQRKPRELTLIAGERSALFYLSISGFEALAQDADNLRNLASLHSDNQRRILAAARDLMNPNVPARIASRLLAVSGWTPDNKSLPPIGPVSITQSDLAVISNVSRKTVNRELAKFAKLGLITQAYGGLLLDEPEGLYRIAKGADIVKPAHKVSGARPRSTKSVN